MVMAKTNGLLHLNNVDLMDENEGKGTLDDKGNLNDVRIVSSLLPLAILYRCPCQHMFCGQMQLNVVVCRGVTYLYGIGNVEFWTYEIKMDIDI
jgi:hypothetical protein